MTRCNFIMSSSAPNWITMICIFWSGIAILFATFSSVSSFQDRIHYDHFWPCRLQYSWAKRMENTDCNIKMFQQRGFVILRPSNQQEALTRGVKMNLSSSTTQVCKLNYSRFSEKRGKEFSKLNTAQTECQKIKRWTNTLDLRPRLILIYCWGKKA